MKRLLKFLLRLLFSLRLINGHRLPTAGPALIMPNHVSFLDPLLLYAHLPDHTCFVVNTDIAARIRFLLRWVKHIVVDPLNPYSLKQIISLVNHGETVVLFPEGRITTTGGLMKVYSGIGLVARKTGAPIYPLILLGPELSRFSRIRDKVRWRWLPTISIHVGEPASLRIDPDKSFRLQKKLLSDQILALLQQNLFLARQTQTARPNLFDALRAAARIHGLNKIIATDIGGKLTYRQTLLGSYALAEQLRPRLQGEERVAVLLPNALGHLLTLFALFYLGKTPAILNFTAGARTCQDCAATAGVRHVLTSRTFLTKGGLTSLASALEEQFSLIYLEDILSGIGPVDKLTALLRQLTGQPAAAGADLVLFTSGSESKPKGVVLHHAHILANLNQLSSIIDYTPQDKFLNALPMFHSFGLTAGTLLPLLNGMEVLLYPTPLHYKIIPEIAYDRNITVLLGTPTFLSGYGRYAHPYDFHCLRYIVAGGEKLKDEVRHLWQDKFGLRILEGYGVTETAPVLSINTPLFYKTGSVGRFLPGIDWRIEPVPGIDGGGNLLVRGPNVMAGYLLAERGFVAAPEWYDCGDVVRVDEEGFVHIQSRLRRFAKISGEMISLDAVENLARQCFGTDQHAAVSLPDSRRGERILLYTANPAAHRQALREWMQQNGVSPLSLPAGIILLEKLPLLGNGKTDYVSLKEQALKEERSHG
ncbi:MAG TPA: AMP-binding protein [Patescibacteria group bacterium]|nr:AMP-binding protein [Patescibacteria group bacterium]